MITQVPLCLQSHNFVLYLHFVFTSGSIIMVQVYIYYSNNLYNTIDEYSSPVYTDQ